MVVEAGQDAERAQFSGRMAIALPAAPAPLSGRPANLGRLAAGWLAQQLAQERDRGALFLTVPVLMGTGVLIYYWLGFEPTFNWVLALLAVSGGVWAVGRRRGGGPALAAGALFFLLAGLAAAQFEVIRASTPMLGSDVTTRMTGRLVAIEHQASGRLRLTIDVLATERPTLRYAPDRVRVTARAMEPGILPGDGITGLVRLFPPQGPVRPDGYDFARESFFEGRGATGFFMGDPVRAEIAEAGWTVSAQAWVERTRMALAERIEGSVTGDAGKIASALIAGLRAGIPEEVNEHLRRTGLAHILSISGLHMALVAFTVMVTIRAGLALFPVMASNRPIKKYAAAVALVAAGAYLFISGVQIAAQRSFIMLAVMLVAVMLDRSALTMRNLAIAAIVVLAVSPHEMLGPSFQMSFAATAALIAGYAAWNARKQSKAHDHREPTSRLGWAGRKIGLYAGGLLLTSILAGGATTLYGIWHFQRMSPLSLAANLAVMPIVSVLVMPFAVLAAVAMPFGLEWLPLAVMEQGLVWMLAIAAWLSERSPLDETGMIPKSALVLLTIALVIVSISTTRLRLLAVPFLVIGLAQAVWRDLPHIFVSEDARLVGVAREDATLAINRARPSNFTTDNWRWALGSSQLRRSESERGAAPEALAERAKQASGFVCSETDCVAARPEGLVAIVESDADLASWCGLAIVVVVQDPTSAQVCREDVVVVTARELATGGAVEITLSANGTAGDARVRRAVAEPLRPWHEHRQFSRAARGLAPPERRTVSPTGPVPEEAAGGAGQ